MRDLFLLGVDVGITLLGVAVVWAPLIAAAWLARAVAPRVRLWRAQRRVRRLAQRRDVERARRRAERDQRIADGTPTVLDALSKTAEQINRAYGVTSDGDAALPKQRPEPGHRLS